MEKTLKYTLTLGGAFPEETLCGGVQGENRATAIVFEADSELTAKISLYKKQGKNIEANIVAVTASGECVGEATQTGEQLFSPFYLTDKVTATGLDVIIIFKLVISAEQKELCKAQVKLSFIPSPVFSEFETEKQSEVEKLEAKAEELTAELEETAQKAEKTIEKKLNAVNSAASLTSEHLKSVKEIAKEALETRLALESGMEFVFTGGNAFEEIAEGFIIDDELSETSNNSIANSVVASAIKKLSADYIVEQGTSGIWTYRKWASGVAECWGVGETINITSLSEWGSLYGTGELSASNISLPFIFVSAPYVDIGVYGSSYAFFAMKDSGAGPTRTTTGRVKLYRGADIENISNSEVIVNLTYSVKGRWK